MSAYEYAPPASALHSELYGHYTALRGKGVLREPSTFRRITAAEGPTPSLDQIWQKYPESRAFARALGRIAESRTLLPIVTPTIEDVSALKMQCYPPLLRAGATPEAVERALGKQRALEFSFLALGKGARGEVEYAGCALARQEPSSLPPTLKEPVLHFGDLVVAREYHNSTLACRMYREMLARAIAAGLYAVETDARGATAYKFLKGGRLLACWGFKIEAEGSPQVIGANNEDREVIYHVRLMGAQHGKP